MPSLFKYLNFDLIISYADGRYHAYVDNAPGGDASSTFELPFADSNLADLLTTINIRRGTKTYASTESKELRELGGELYDAVFSNKIRSVFVASQQLAEIDGKALRIRLRFRDDAIELAMLPWEILFDTEQQRFLALSEDRPILRYLPLPQPWPTLSVHPPLSILAVLSSPSDETFEPLKIEQEWQAIEAVLAPLIAAKQVILERLDPPTVEALRSRLLKDPVHVLHFVGHGSFEPSAGLGVLIFERSDGRSEVVTAKSLAMLLHNHKPMRLVYLNACDGAISDQINVFAGVAQALVQQGVPAAVAMQDEITDEAAIEMARNFYTALANGRPVDAALTHARVCLAARGNDEWVIPVLFSRAPNNQLLNIPDNNVVTVFERNKPWEPETIAVAGGEFVMGSAAEPSVPANETPMHSVTLASYRIGKYPVTNLEYAAFVTANPHQSTPDYWFLRKPPDDRCDHPVTDVSWHDAVAYCIWLTETTARHYRLPTEAEWERAARGTKGRRYPWGNEWLDDICNIGGSDTIAVDMYADRYTEIDPVDLLGNVQEWTSTLWGGDPRINTYPYPFSPDDGREDMKASAHPNSAFRIHRGGSYLGKPGHINAATRGNAEARSSSKRRGFRVVMDLSEPAI